MMEQNNAENLKHSEQEKPISFTDSAVSRQPLQTPLMKTKSAQGRACPAIMPLPGYVWNPLRSLPRNSQCPCKSGKKFKACCLNKLPPAVKKEIAKEYEEQMSKPDFIFLTNENHERMKEIIDPLVMAEKEKELKKEITHE